MTDPVVVIFAKCSNYEILHWLAVTKNFWAESDMRFEHCLASLTRKA